MDKYKVKIDEELEYNNQKRGLSYRCAGIIVLVVLVLSAALCAAVVIPLFQNRDETSAKETTSTSKSSTQQPIVYTEADTECGKIKGIMEKGAHVFKGIPYAEPPVGNLRWKPPIMRSPENNNCWIGTLDTLDYGNVCTQNLNGVVGDEDCLFFHLWTPTLDKTAHLPVMVHIHGGNLQALSGYYPDISPSGKLAVDTQIVYVSLNYRLNVFGFLALDLLTRNSSTNSSGNYGFMDQLLVLHWVQRNIRNFGGNPSLVTIFGESSGGTSVMALLASPLSQNLFHRAWLMSSSVVLNRTLSEASNDNLIFLDNTNCTDLDCLYGLSKEQLMMAIPYNVWPHWIMDDLTYLPTKGLFNGALAIVDGYVLEDSPLEVFRSGRGMKVPVMIGTQAQETDMLPPLNVRNWTWANYTDHLSNKLGPFGDEIVNRTLEFYPPQQNLTPEYQLTTLSTDIRATCQNHVLANSLASSSRVRAYRYIGTSFPAKPFSFEGVPFAPMYAFHGWDAIVFYNDLSTFFDEPSKENLAFQRLLKQEMMYFVRNGFPYTLAWRSYPNHTAILSENLDFTPVYHSEQCDFFLANGFFSYGWIN